MSQSDAHIVILGAGHAGGTAAALLRQYGHTGLITLVGEEPVPPYQRPPLSKAWLKGEADADSLALKPLEFYAENNIDFRPNVRAEKLARSDKTVTLSNGETLSYDLLIIATGCRTAPEETEGMLGPKWRVNVHDFYTLDGAKALRSKLASFAGGRIVVHINEMPIKCPVAPLEFTFLADTFFRQRKLRDKVTLTYVTPLSGAFTKPKSSQKLG